MILGLSHIFLSVKDTVFQEGLASRGYARTFTEMELRNTEAKRPYLNQWTATHRLSYWERKNETPLELINYAKDAGQLKNTYIPVFSGKPDKGSSKAAFPMAVQDALTQALPGLVQFQQDEIHGLHGISAENGSPQTILLEVQNLEKSRDFWNTAMGFKTKKTADHWALLENAALVAHWRLRLLMIETKSEPSFAKLDHLGCHCLGFLCSHPKRLADRMCEKGALDASAEFEVEVNSKNLKICLVRGPAGEIIELIAPEKTPPIKV